MSKNIAAKYTLNDKDLKSLYNDIKSIGTSLRYNLSIQFLFTGLLLERYIDIQARKLRQNRSRMEILQTLITHGGELYPTNLSKMLFRSKQTITGTIDGLERDGLIKRELYGADRRTKKVILTKNGLRESKNSLPNILATVNKAMPKLTDDQMSELSGILKQIRQHLLMLVENNNGQKSSPITKHRRNLDSLK